MVYDYFLESQSVFGAGAFSIIYSTCLHDYFRNVHNNVRLNALISKYDMRQPIIIISTCKKKKNI